MKYYCIPYICILLLFSCKEKSSEITVSTSITPGVYSGTFEYLSSIATDTGIAQLTFTSISYTCLPIQSNHLMSGAGTYTIDNSIIIFTDTTIHVHDSRLGDFLLAGEYTLSVKGASLSLMHRDDTANRLIKFELTLKE